MVDISPRLRSRGYPLYHRDRMRDRNKALIKTVKRCVPARWPQTF